jgi:hypothetical protein
MRAKAGPLKQRNRRPPFWQSATDSNSNALPTNVGSGAGQYGVREASGSARASFQQTLLLLASARGNQQQKEIVRAAYTLNRKDGSTRTVPEQRHAIEGVSSGEINRELTILKRIFSLAIQAGKLLHKPHIPLLEERNTRTGFFEFEQFVNVRGHLPAALQPVIEFAYITGWRITSDPCWSLVCPVPPSSLVFGRYWTTLGLRCQ